MIINLFKTNQLSGIVFLFIFQLMLFANAVWHPMPVLPVYPETWLYQQSFGWLARFPWVNIPLSFVLIFAQALLYNYFIIQLNILGRTTYLPALFYVLACCMVPGNIYLHPGHVGLIVSLPGLILFFQAVNGKYPLRQAFNAALLFSFGSLFYPPLAGFLVFIWVGLATMDRLTFRSWLVSIIGFLVPYTYLFALLFWNDGVEAYVLRYLLPFAGLPDLLHTPFAVAELALYALLVFIMASSVWKFLNTRFSYKVVQRKIYRVFAWFFATIIATAAYLPFFSRHHLVLMALPGGVFLSFYFLHLRRQWWADVITLLLFATIFFFQFGYY